MVGMGKKRKGGKYNSFLKKKEGRDLFTPFFERAERGELTTVAQIKQAFENRVGHEVDETTIHRLLKRQKWRKLVRRPSHPQADKEEQELVEQSFATLVEEVLQSRDPKDERPVLNMAQDEACFGRICISRRSWAPKHIRPLIPRQIVREYTYVYAVVAPREGKMTSLILPFADTSMMNIFLEHVSRTFSQYFLVIQVDQA